MYKLLLQVDLKSLMKHIELPIKNTKPMSIDNILNRISYNYLKICCETCVNAFNSQLDACVISVSPFCHRRDARDALKSEQQQKQYKEKETLKSRRLGQLISRNIQAFHYA